LFGVGWENTGKNKPSKGTIFGRTIVEALTTEIPDRGNINHSVVRMNLDKRKDLERTGDRHWQRFNW
jgi:hypothetical protein